MGRYVETHRNPKADDQYTAFIIARANLTLYILKLRHKYNTVETRDDNRRHRCEEDEAFLFLCDTLTFTNITTKVIVKMFGVVGSVSEVTCASGVEQQGKIRAEGACVPGAAGGADDGR